MRNHQKISSHVALVLFISGALSLAGATVAHVGVENPAVMARMHAMKGIGDNFKLLVAMNKGEHPFDQVAARAAAAAIAGHAAETPALFKAPEDDPKSEAKRAIWEEFDDFTAKARDLETRARNLSTSLQSKADLQSAVLDLGQTCRACHDSYREKNS